MSEHSELQQAAGDSVVTVIPTDAVPDGFLERLRPMLDSVFTWRFDDDDWAHALGGRHAVVLGPDGDIRAHAAVVERVVEVDGTPFRTGYVESVAADNTYRGAGYGAAVMREITAIIRRDFEFGALGTSIYDFYAQFGWERWSGPSFMRAAAPGEPDVRTADYDTSVMVVRHGASAAVDLAAPIVCDWRPGAPW